MNRIFQIIFIGLVTLLLVGCNTTNSNQQQILAGASQVQLRSFQTRTYDTDDKIRVLRAVVATLQDLGFVLDKADDVVGIVSATKMDRSKSNYQFYRLSMSISVRPSGDQMIVRANAQLNLTAIEDPGPYQDFFTSLDKGLFLDDNLLANSKSTQNIRVEASKNLEADIGEDAFAYYGQAEKEIVSGTYDDNLWAKAFVLVEGDEQKRKAKYIELRAYQLYSQSAATKSDVNSNNQTSVIPPSALPGQIKPVGLVPNVSGSWVSDIKTSRSDYFKIKDRKLVLSLEQYDNWITGTDESGKAEISGKREGDVIKFTFWHPKIGEGCELDGKWKLNSDNTGLEGSWQCGNGGGANGQWNLTPIGEWNMDVSVEEESNNARAIRLNGAQVIEHLSGRTEVWAHGGAYYGADGEMEALWKGKVVTGKWEVSADGNVCYELTKWPRLCQFYMDFDDGITMIYKGKSTGVKVMMEGYRLSEL